MISLAQVVQFGRNRAGHGESTRRVTASALQTRCLMLPPRRKCSRTLRPHSAPTSSRSWALPLARGQVSCSSAGVCARSAERSGRAAIKALLVLGTLGVLFYFSPPAHAEDIYAQIGSSSVSLTPVWASTGSTQVDTYSQWWTSPQSGYVCDLSFRMGWATIDGGTKNSAVKVQVLQVESGIGDFTGTTVGTYYITPESELPSSSDGSTSEFTSITTLVNCFSVQSGGVYRFIITRDIPAGQRVYANYLGTGTSSDGRSCQYHTVAGGWNFCGNTGVTESGKDLDMRIGGFTDPLPGSYTPTGAASRIDLIGADEYCKGEFIDNTSTASADLVVTAGRGFAYSLCYAAGFLFIPSDAAKESLFSQIALVKDKAPFSYVDDFKDIFAQSTATSSFPTISIPWNVFGASSSVAIISSASFSGGWVPSSAWSALRSLSTTILYVVWAFAVFKLARSFIHTL